ncbi:MAG: Hsp20/alpha crystallin family protein [Candidatus Bipolaricaulota bacterium]
MTLLPRVWREPFRLTDDVGRLVDNMFKSFGDLDLDVAPSFGRSDVYLKDNTLIIETELPGARKEDVQVKVQDHNLVVTGEVRRSEEAREEDYIRMGRRCGRFRRRFPLPEEVAEPNQVKAKFHDGILRVEVPLKQSPKEGEGVQINVE